jgi:hypothetical protein
MPKVETDPLERARQAFVATRYAEAAEAYQLAAAKLTGPRRTETLYRSALSRILVQDSASLARAQVTLGQLLVEVEPEEPLYGRLLLLQAWGSLQQGDAAAAQRQFRVAELQTAPTETPRSLWICSEILHQAGNPAGADSCATQLQLKYGKSLEARFADGVPRKGGSPSALPPKRPEGAANSTPATGAHSVDNMDPSGPWTIQVGAFGDRANAKKMAGSLARLPGEVRVVPLAIKGADTTHLVRIYAFPDRESAEAYKKRHLDPLGLLAQPRKRE